MRVKRIFIGLTAALIFAVVPFRMTLSGLAITPTTDGISPDVVKPLAVATDYASVPGPTTTHRNGQNGDTAIEKSKPWDRIDFTSRRLKNNVWGAPAGETLTSGIYLNNKSFGWYWSRQNPKARSVLSTVKPIYPCVRIGASPWEKSNSKYFPARLSDVKSLKFEVDYNYDTVPTGSYDLAYDMFLTDTNQPSPNPDIKAEVMVWIHAAAREQPWITHKGNVSDGVNAYTLYSWVMADGRKYYSFILKGEPEHRAHHSVDAKRLMDSLELDPAWYVNGIEFGNEIWNGSGRIEISQFNVTMNGSEL